MFPRKYLSAGRCFLLTVFLAIPSEAGQVLVGTQPFIHAPLRFSVDIFPLSLGSRRQSDIMYWHGLATGIAFEGNTKMAGISYGLSFTGLNSGGMFAGPLINVTSRTIGFSIDIIYSFFSVPLKISLQRMTSRLSNHMLFSVVFSGGIGLPYPLIRLEDNRFKHAFDR